MLLSFRNYASNHSKGTPILLWLHLAANYYFSIHVKDDGPICGTRNAEWNGAFQCGPVVTFEGSFSDTVVIREGVCEQGRADLKLRNNRQKVVLLMENKTRP